MGEYHINPRQSDEPIDDDERRAIARDIIDRAEAEQARRRAAFNHVLDFSGVAKADA